MYVRERERELERKLERERELKIGNTKAKNRRLEEARQINPFFICFDNI